MKKLVVVTLLVLVGFANSAGAQEQFTFKVGETFRVTFEHAGLDTSAYRLTFDGVQVGADLPVAGTREFRPAPVSVTSTNIAVRVIAVGTNGVPTPSDPVMLKIVSPDPVKPTNIKILGVQIVDNRDGTSTLEFKLVDAGALAR